MISMNYGVYTNRLLIQEYGKGATLYICYFIYCLFVDGDGALRKFSVVEDA